MKTQFLITPEMFLNSTQTIQDSIINVELKFEDGQIFLIYLEKTENNNVYETDLNQQVLDYMQSKSFTYRLF